MYLINLCCLMFLLHACSSVVEPLSIPYPSPNSSLQEDFKMDLVPLTLVEAKKLNSDPYPRFVSVPKGSFSANLVNEDDVIHGQFPPGEERFTYKLGVGDELSLSVAFDQTTQVVGGLQNSVGSLSSSAQQSATTAIEPTQIIPDFKNTPPVISVTKSRVGNDGGLLLLGIGRLDAEDRQLSDLRDEVRSILIQNGQAPNFQLEIAEFNSQKAFISTDSPPDEKPDRIQYVLPITDRGTTLREILATAGIAFNEKYLTTIKIQRSGLTYALTLSDLFSDNAPEVYLKDKDHIFIQNLEYQAGKVFLVGGIKPRLILINPENRQTLAEALFSEFGPMEIPTAQRSAIYLLRGYNPVKAYHLDAQNPTRILVADTVELRPNDIVFVGEQPISTFNRVLETILPLRIFSRDVKNDNLP